MMLFSSVFGSTILIAASCSYLVALSFGYAIGYSSPALSDMEDTGVINTEGAALFGSLITIGGVIGCLLAGFVMESFGRKKGLLITCIPFILGWQIIGFSSGIYTSIAMLYIGRTLTGIASGMATVIMSVYVSETSPSQYRGMLGAGVQLAITVGILVVYILGVVCHWHTLAMVGCVFPIIAMLLLTKVPETPRWYLLKGHKAEAFRALQHLRGTMDVEDEISDIIDGLPPKGDSFSMRDLFKPNVWTPLKIVIILMIFQQASGINAIMFYTVTIFESAGFKDSSIGATISVGAVQVLATMAGVYLMDKVGRRPLIFLGGSVMAASCFMMGLYYYWAESSYVEHLAWMPLASLIFFIIGFSLSWGPIPGLIMSEVFPVKARGAASAISCTCNWITAFVITSNFLIFIQTLGSANTYWGFCIATALGTFLVYLYVPETKGKTLEEIELIFLGRSIHGV